MPRYAALVYNGFWFSPEREALQRLVDDIAQAITGTARLKLYKGAVTVLGRKAPQQPVPPRHRHVRGGLGLRPARRAGLHQAQRAAPADPQRARRCGPAAGGRDSTAMARRGRADRDRHGRVHRVHPARRVRRPAGTLLAAADRVGIVLGACVIVFAPVSTMISRVSEPDLDPAISALAGHDPPQRRDRRARRIARLGSLITLATYGAWRTRRPPSPAADSTVRRLGSPATTCRGQLLGIAGLVATRGRRLIIGRLVVGWP